MLTLCKYSPPPPTFNLFISVFISISRESWFPFHSVDYVLINITYLDAQMFSDLGEPKNRTSSSRPVSSFFL